MVSGPAPTRRPTPAQLGAAALLVVVALGVRVGYVAATWDYAADHHDPYRYVVLARAIARDGAYPSDRLVRRDRNGKRVEYTRGSAWRPPVYPYLLAAASRLTGHPCEFCTRALEVRDRMEAIRLARIVQAILGTVAVALLGLIARRLFGPGVALLAMALAAVAPGLVLSGGSILSESVFVPLALGAILAALVARDTGRWRWVAAAGVLVGLATLTRTNGLVLAGPLALAVWTGRPRLRPRALARPAVLVACTFLAIAPWTIRNLVVMGEPVLVSTEVGATLAGTYNDVSANAQPSPTHWVPPRSVPELERFDGGVEQSPTVRDDQLRREAFEYVEEHPTYPFTVAWWNLRRLTELSGREWAEETYFTIGVGPEGTDRGMRAFHVLGILALLGLLTRRAWSGPLWLWLVPLAVLASAVFVTIEAPRFRAPIEPFFALLGALALAAAGERLAALRYRFARANRSAGALGVRS